MRKSGKKVRLIVGSGDDGRGLVQHQCHCLLFNHHQVVQNQMAQCFFIGLYDIETGDNFYFFQKKFLMGGNGF